jgi:hypothetical protein
MTDHEPIRRLAQALLARPDSRACDAVLDRLDAYIAAQLGGADYATRWPDIAWHLDSCVDCAEAYALHYEARLAEQRAPDPQSIPAPDLSFLPGAAPLHVALAAAVERASGRLRLRLSQALLDLLPPPSSPALALRSSDEAGAPLFDLELDAPDEAIERLQLTAYRQPGHPGDCLLRVQLKLRDRDWPDLAQIPIALHLGDQRRQALTDPWGEAVFDALPEALLPELLVEVDAG